MSKATRLVGLSAVLAVASLCSLATAAPLFAGSLLEIEASPVLVWSHVAFGSTFCLALAAKLVLLGRRARPSTVYRAWSALVAHLAGGLALYTLVTGVLVLIAEVWADQHLAAAFWMTVAVVVHARQYRVRAAQALAGRPRETPEVVVVQIPPRSRRSGRARLVVVGAGMAGHAVAAAVRRRAGHDLWSITLLGAEPDAPYNRVRLSDALAGRVPPGDLMLRDIGWYRDHAIDLRTDCRVDDVDIRRCLVGTATGERHGYDALVIATGSQPSIPPIPGIDLPHVMTFRTRRDVERIAGAATAARAAVVIGGGLLGLEAAAGLAGRGMAVTVLERSANLMPQQLDDVASRLIERALRRRGILCRTDAGVRAITRDAVVLESGESCVASLVVIATGITPETTLARRAGLGVAHGIVVDDELRASEPRVWAVGECASHRGATYGVWAPIAEQAEVASAVITGAPAVFRGAATATTLKVAGLDVLAGGRPGAGAGQHEVVWRDAHRGAYRKFVLDEDRLVGLMLVGDTTHGDPLGAALRDRQVVPAGLLRPATTAITPELADDGRSELCRCARVSAGEVIRSIRAGSDTVAAITDATGAGGGCGSCRPTLADLLAEHAATHAPVAD